MATRPIPRRFRAMCLGRSSQDGRSPSKPESRREDPCRAVGRKLTVMKDLREAPRYRSPNTNMALPDVTAKYCLPWAVNVIGEQAIFPPKLRESSFLPVNESNTSM